LGEGLRANPQPDNVDNAVLVVVVAMATPL